jgi:hypothetical protein
MRPGSLVQQINRLPPWLVLAWLAFAVSVFVLAVLLSTSLMLNYWLPMLSEQLGSAPVPAVDGHVDAAGSSGSTFSDEGTETTPAVELPNMTFCNLTHTRARDYFKTPLLVRSAMNTVCCIGALLCPTFS